MENEVKSEVEIRTYENPEALELEEGRIVVDVPTTIYDQMGRVMGIVYPDGRVLRPAGTRVGQPVHLRDEYGQEWEGEVGWDGAAPDPNGGHSKGLLLGEYEREDIDNVDFEPGFMRYPTMFHSKARNKEGNDA